MTVPRPTAHPAKTNITPSAYEIFDRPTSPARAQVTLCDRVFANAEELTYAETGAALHNEEQRSAHWEREARFQHEC